MENAHARKWPMYLGIGAGSVTVAGFALAAMTENVSWVLVLLITCIAGIEMAVTSVFTLKGRPKNPVEVAEPLPVQAAEIEQIAATIKKPALTAKEIENLPHIVVKTENSVPKIDSMKPAPSMANSTGGIYIDSIDLVRQQLSQIKVPKETKRQQLSQIKVPKETKKVSKNEKDRTKATKKKDHEGTKKEKVKPTIKNARHKIARLVKPTARA
ncbi:MAG: hypothetical protein ABSF36_01810 [Candidatus Methanomethylicaceae archaeon]|jgi:hypothetical protein